jgi:hypothetical protein
MLKSQQEMMNGMNTLLFTLLNKMHSSCESSTSTESNIAADELPCTEERDAASLEEPARDVTEASPVTSDSCAENVHGSADTKEVELSSQVTGAQPELGGE